LGLPGSQASGRAVGHTFGHSCGGVGAAQRLVLEQCIGDRLDSRPVASEQHTHRRTCARSLRLVEQAAGLIECEAGARRTCIDVELLVNGGAEVSTGSHASEGRSLAAQREVTAPQVGFWNSETRNASMLAGCSHGPYTTGFALVKVTLMVYPISQSWDRVDAGHNTGDPSAAVTFAIGRRRQS